MSTQRVPPITTQAWPERGACRGADPEIFFHPTMERGEARRQRAWAAKTVCASCPVLMECRQWALTAREPHGTWGGLTEEDREDSRKGRPVQRHPEPPTEPTPVGVPGRPSSRSVVTRAAIMLADGVPIDGVCLALDIDRSRLANAAAQRVRYQRSNSRDDPSGVMVWKMALVRPMTRRQRNVTA